MQRPNVLIVGLLTVFAAWAWLLVSPVVSQDLDLTSNLVDADDEFSEDRQEQEETLVVDPVSLNLQPEPLPAAPSAIEADVAGTAAEREFVDAVFGSEQATRSLLSQSRRARSEMPGTDVVLGSEARFRATTDAGNLLHKSRSATGMAAQQRGPIITDSRIRGSQIGQILGSGSYWFPVRQDLDTMLSKIDSRIIANSIIVKGPYAARYGPGYNFIDIELLRSPRYSDGYESHMGTSLDYKSNGDQWYGRHTFWGGSDNYGYRIGYGYRAGSDYLSGSGVDIPSSYKSGDLDVAFGYDISCTQHVEFTYLRLDQNDVEVPTQIFDISYLKTNAYELTYTEEDGPFYDYLTVEGWYNESSFNGNAQGAGKRRQIPFLNGAGFTGFTDGNNASMGYSAAATWGDPCCTNVTLGTDFRYLKQELNEIDMTSNAVVFPPGQFQNFPIPRGHQANPGIFLETTVPAACGVTMKAGGRVDWVSMNARTNVPGTNLFGSPDIPAFIGGPDASFDQNFYLYSGFLTLNWQVTDEWAANVGAGYGMRAPTMTEMYADGPFITVMPQYAGTSIAGNPFLLPERRWQVDLGVRADYGKLRFGAGGYYAWVRDYVTLDLLALNPVVGTGGIPIYQYVNTPQATLTGGEFFGEYDITGCLTAFGTMSYTEGRDRTRAVSNSPIRNLYIGGPRSDSTAPSQPLPVIYPLYGTVGLRYLDPCCQRWGIELSARIVNQQNRVASALLETRTGGFTTFDVRGFYNLNDCWTFVGGVENFTDRNYREHFDPRVFSNMLQPGANFYCGVERTY